MHRGIRGRESFAAEDLGEGHPVEIAQDHALGRDLVEERTGGGDHEKVGGGDARRRVAARAGDQAALLELSLCTLCVDSS